MFLKSLKQEKSVTYFGCQRLCILCSFIFIVGRWFDASEIFAAAWLNQTVCNQPKLYTFSLENQRFLKYILSR